MKKDLRRCWTCLQFVPLRKPLDPKDPRLIRHGDAGKPECPAGGKPVPVKVSVLDLIPT